MRLRFLGTGTSSGIPVIGCSCPTCTSTDPRDARLRTSALLTFTDRAGQHRAVLLDAGPDLRHQALAARMTRCDAVLLTHNHVDHTWGLDELRRFNVLMDARIPIYADTHTLDSVRAIYRHIFEPGSNVQRSFVADLDPIAIEPLTPFTLFDTLRVTPLPLLHGVLPILGFRFDLLAPTARAPRDAHPIFPLAYCTDVSAIPDAARTHLSGLRTLVLDALRHRPHPTHFTLAQAVAEARAIAAESTFLVHMTHDLCHAPTQALLPENIRLAFDTLEIGGPMPE